MEEKEIAEEVVETATEIKGKKDKDKKAKKESKPKESKESLEEKRIKELEAELIDIKLKAANTINEQKRLRELFMADLKYSGKNVLADLVDILDTFGMAINFNSPSPEISNFLMGFKMIEGQFNSLLEDHGVKQIACKVGDKLNPELHQGIEVVYDTEHEDNTIVEIIQAGYMHYDRLLKATVVKVAGTKPEVGENTENESEEVENDNT